MNSDKVEADGAIHDDEVDFAAGARTDARVEEVVALELGVPFETALRSRWGVFEGFAGEGDWVLEKGVVTFVGEEGLG